MGAYYIQLKVIKIQNGKIGSAVIFKIVRRDQVEDLTRYRVDEKNAKTP